MNFFGKNTAVRFDVEENSTIEDKKMTVLCCSQLTSLQFKQAFPFDDFDFEPVRMHIPETNYMNTILIRNISEKDLLNIKEHIELNLERLEEIYLEVKTIKPKFFILKEMRL